MLKGKSIICFAGEDWWYHHPHSKNHIMKRLAKQNRVMFINSISMGLPSVRSADFFLKIRRKLRSYARFVRRSTEGIIVVSPIVLPFWGRWGRAINRLLLIFQIRLLMLLFGFKDPILWLAIPTAKDVIGKLGESLIIYQISDKYELNHMDHSTSAELIKQLSEQIKERADIIYYSGRKLFAEAVEHRDKSHLLEQAVDFEHFASTTERSFGAPDDIGNIKKPILGYFGAIESWLVDQDLIKYVSERRPHWNWVFIGNKARELEIESLPNVKFLGPKNYFDLPAYAAQFDVCVLPWVTHNEWVNYGSAIKVREYLATGKPVVITPLYEYEHMDGLVRIARSYDHFIALIEESLTDDSQEKKQARQAAVRDSTWAARAEEVSRLIEHTLNQQRNNCRSL